LNLIIPSNNTINKFNIDFKKYQASRYFIADLAITNLFKSFPENNKIEDILLKINAINTFYSTNIYSIYKLASYILTLRIDLKLAKGEFEVVNEICVGHGIPKPKGQGDRNLYSFASKYCSWHNSNTFPIYDDFVGQILIAYRQKDFFSDFEDIDLKDYKKFVKIISDFKFHYKLTEHNLKEIDKFLWMYGKEQFPKKYYKKK